MATEFKYLTKEEIFELHNQIIEEIGGTHGLREEGGIDQLTDFVENDWYYPTLEDKLTYIVFSLCTGHYFVDGNKRISIVAGAHFLIKNKKSWAAMRFYEYFHAYAWHIAAGNIDKDLFTRIVHCYINYKEMDESLKLEIANAISEGHQIYDEQNEQQSTV